MIPAVSSVVPSAERRWLRVSMYLLLIAGAAVLYLPHAGIPFFADDFEFRFVDPRPYILGAFGYNHLHWFRPIKASWCALNQYLFGEDTFVLQAGQIAMHAALTCGLFWFLRTCGLPLWHRLLGAVWFLVNPINVFAILSGDTNDQVGSGAAGFLSFALAWRFSEALRQAPSGPAPPLRLAVGSLMALAIALLCKETSVAFAGIVPLVLGFALWRGHGGRVPGATRWLVLFLVACVALTAGYFVYRGAARDPGKWNTVSWGTVGGEFRIGGNILVNEAQLLGAPLLPFSTADAYVAVVHRAPLVLVAMGAGLLAWLALLGAGLTIAKQWPAALGLGVLAACAGVPVMLRNHVSELYAYNLAPFWAVIVALALPALLTPRRPRLVRIVTAVLLLGVLTSDVVAVHRKASQMAVHGHNAVVLMPQVVDFARQLPPGGTLLLWDRQESERVHYSVFLGGPFMSVTGPEVVDWVKHLARRPDINIYNESFDEPPFELLEPGDIVLIPDTTGGALRVRALPMPSSP
jgi:hypothetical protein